MMLFNTLAQKGTGGCDKEGFDLDICELDKEYFESGIKRYEQFKAQITLF